MSEDNKLASVPVTMQALDPLTFPLGGAALIEASAGTGKTYTIVNLYLRLLLGHGFAPLSVEQILVVTFTNAATGELKDRIRQRLRQAYLAFFAQHSDDPVISQLIAQSSHIEQDCQRLALASKQMDEAAVFTIHGFCQKALTEHAFESGAMYQQHFILDQTEWLTLAVEDYWRKHVVTLDKHSLTMLLAIWSAPQKLLSSIQNLLNQPVHPAQSVNIQQAQQNLQAYVEQLDKVKSWWLDNQLSQLLAKANLKANAKLAKSAFLNEMQAFCQSDKLLLDFGSASIEDFFPEKLEKAKKKTGSEDLSHLDFSQFEQLQHLLEKATQGFQIAFSLDAVKEVAANLSSHKQRLQLLSPDDLLAGLNAALKQQTNLASGSPSLANAIRTKYPAVLIDEFQDTDPVQFDLFKAIYAGQENAHTDSSWIMIGDPKQAIYAFRGADIFTYIKAKEWVPKQKHYTLDTNWRSAPKLIDAINHLFASSNTGFLFEQSIPFYPVKAGKDMAGVTIQGQSIACLDFQHLCADNEQPISASEAIPLLAQNTAEQIALWLDLAEKGQAQIQNRAIKAGDCCVLVRNRHEAQIIKTALAKVNVASVFLARQSVFATQIAEDLYRLLQALSQPTDERRLKAALMSQLFNFTAAQLDALFNNEVQWQQVLEQSFGWHHIWQKQGLSKAINLVLQYFDVEQSLLLHQADGLRLITDLRHLIELLQQHSQQLVGEAQLLHWFESCLLEPDHNSESQQVRLENDANLVQIITLHSSKGLEYPLVFVPFASTFKPSKQALYHNDKQQLEVDFLAQADSLAHADFERLAEDLRLFYVAVTRAVYYCSIGVWNASLGGKKPQSAFAQTALGNILLNNKTLDLDSPKQNVTDKDIAEPILLLAKQCDIAYSALTEAQIKEKPSSISDQTHSQTHSEHELTALVLSKPVIRSWRLTSYSAISSQQSHLDMPAPGQDEGLDAEQVQYSEVMPASLALQSNLFSPFNFERGANAGSFLHGVLENIDFQQPEQLAEVINQQSKWFGIAAEWQPCLEQWLTDVLLAPFTTKPPTQLRLAELTKQQVKVEMEFYLPLQHIQVHKFNQLINRYFPQHRRDYQFDQLNGMLKGYIDLMFEYEGKFYVADYKSNHLGDSYSDYHFAAMEKAMTEHDYHLQAILYTLAMHRWLKNKIANYQYQQHIGGAYYLFIRGMSQQHPANGVYAFLPEQGLIEALDLLFAGQADQAIAAKSSPEQTQGQLDLW